MKQIVCIFLILMLSVVYVQGQISTKEIPVGYSLDRILKYPSDKIQVLPALNMERIQKEDMEDETNGLPPRFGYKHEVDFNLENSGSWETLPNGDRIWHLELYCPEALSINLLYDKFRLPDGAKYFIYSNDRKHSIGAFTSANNKASGGFATGLVYGDRITLEYVLPKSTKETGKISISYVVHGYRYIQLPETDKSYNGSGSCNININCTEGDNWQNEKNAVAMIVVNGYRLCSGSLINTTTNSALPLFLTAHHCLDGHDSESSPSLTDWSFYWHYESPTCTSSYDPPYFSTSGATVVANNSYSDFALLQLTEDPKSDPDINTYYLGWDRTGNSGIGGVGIHHPSGDIKKISLYTMSPQSTAYLSNTVSSTANHWRVVWTAGTTEVGSSGSPLITSGRYVIGQLHGGYASCDATSSPDWYGKFSVSWDYGSTSTRRLKDWLDPNNTGISILDGSSGCVNSYTNQTVTTNTTVTGCSDLTVQNVTVSNNANLTLTAPNSVIINGSFEVAIGSTLNVQ
jgi:hypothetical protein